MSNIDLELQAGIVHGDLCGGNILLASDAAAGPHGFIAKVCCVLAASFTFSRLRRGRHERRTRLSLRFPSRTPSSTAACSAESRLPSRCGLLAEPCYVACITIQMQIHSLGWLHGESYICRRLRISG